MLRFLQNFDRISFWLGFLAASLFWWLISFLRPWMSQLLQSVREGSKITKLGAAAVAEIRIRNEVLRFVQGLHLAEPLFSLDEIAITPRLIAPPALTEPGVVPAAQDVTELVIPYLPDAPELSSFYAGPTITLVEALQGNANVVVMGGPGSGKTVALAQLAAQVSRQENLPAYLAHHVPMYLHCSSLLGQPDSSEGTLRRMIEAFSKVCPSLPLPRMEVFLAATFSEGRILLLLDGLDELPPQDFNLLVAFLGKLLQEYPSIRVVTTASPEYLDGLTALEFIPLSMASWNETQRREFINRWSEQWSTQVEPTTKDAESIDTILLNAWLTNDAAILNPLELTLKVWGVYAGDLMGSGIKDWIEAYLQRMSVNVSKGRIAMEILARQALLAQKPIFTPKEAQGWLRDIEPLPVPEPVLETKTQEGESVWPPPLETEKSTQAVEKPIRDSRIVPDMLERGLLKSYGDDRLIFSQPLMMSYLAACDLESKDWHVKEAFPENWATSTLARGFLASRQDGSDLINAYIEKSTEPLFSELFSAARWLRYAPETVTWRSTLMRQLTKVLQNESLPAGCRARALSAIALSGSPGVDALFRQLLSAPDKSLHIFAALGCGVLRDVKAVNDLKELLKDIQPHNWRAACLALVAIGHPSALEAVADILLHGNEDQSKAAAEALANHPEEGYPTLKEGATLDNLMVRRAVVYGLARIHQPWAIDLLGRMQVSDAQWVVKDAATQVLEEKDRPNSRLPKRSTELTETPWLIAFAGERGIGISPGKPVIDLLLLALNEGKEEQKMAALEYFSRHTEVAAIPGIEQIYKASHGDVRETALLAVWYYAAAGIKFPLAD